VLPLSDEPAKARFEQLVVESQQRLDDTRTQYFIERARTGGVSRDTQSQLHAAVLGYYATLRRYRDASAVQDSWPAELDELEEYVDGWQVVERDQAGDGASSTTEQRPAVLPAEEAIRKSFVLDDVATDLGFAASTETALPTERGFDQSTA